MFFVHLAVISQSCPCLCSSDDSLIEETSSVERTSQSDDESALPTDTPTDQSEAFVDDDAQNNLEARPEVSEAALEDGSKKK